MCHTSHGSLMLSNICSFMACLALLEILIPISLIDSIPHQVYSLNWWTEWFPLLYVSIMPLGMRFLSAFTLLLVASSRSCARLRC